MTERWQKHLRALREIEPPTDGWRRAETRDPSGDGLPPPRQRIAAGIVAFGVFIAAAAFGWTAFRPSGLNTSVGEDPGPALTVSLDLDCRAESQVAFRHHHIYLLPAGESFVRANVPGIRPTDELVPPADGGGDDGLHGVWKVMREGKTVASINYPTLDGITCRFNAIGTAESN